MRAYRGLKILHIAKLPSQSQVVEGFVTAEKRSQPGLPLRLRWLPSASTATSASTYRQKAQPFPQNDTGKGMLHSAAGYEIERGLDCDYQFAMVSKVCGRNSVGRVRASQARCRRFEPARPLSLLHGGSAPKPRDRSVRSARPPCPRSRTCDAFARGLRSRTSLADFACGLAAAFACGTCGSAAFAFRR